MVLSRLVVDAGSDALAAVPYRQARAVEPVHVLEGMDQYSVARLVMLRVLHHVRHGVKMLAAVVDLYEMFRDIN